MTETSNFLKRALLADAAVSGASALLQLMAAEMLAQYTALSAALLRGTGVFLIAYVALLVGMALRPRLPRALVWVVIVGNVAWAIGALALCRGLPMLGVAFCVIQAATVLVFAELEYVGLGRGARAEVAV